MRKVLFYNAQAEPLFGVVLVIKPFLLWNSRCRHRRVFVRSLNELVFGGQEASLR